MNPNKLAYTEGIHPFITYAVPEGRVKTLC
jgi:hypothetical protein